MILIKEPGDIELRGSRDGNKDPVVIFGHEFLPD
jgi:hypothetical protein